MTRKQQRLSLILGGLAILGIAAGLVLYALSGSITFFLTPSEIADKGVVPGQLFRIGGLVEKGSVKRGEGVAVAFTVTDTIKITKVEYAGQLPDLFREGQGVVAEGRLDGAGIFHADTVLAKHDETYMPKELADSLKAKGLWQDGKKP